MKDIRLDKVKSSEIELLRSLSINTFITAFGRFNDPKNMDMFLRSEKSIEQFKKEHANPNSEFYFAFANDELAGYMKINQGDAQVEQFDRSSIELERIYVIQKFQGSGIGAQMMTAFEKMGRDRNVEMLWLGVWEKNPRGIMFYRRLGFEIFGEHSFLVGTDLQTDVLMRKLL